MTAALDDAARTPPPVSLWVRCRRWAYGYLLLGPIQVLLRVLRHVPGMRPESHGVVVTADVPYVDGGHRKQRLDVYRLRDAAGPLPVCIYVHGGGFRYFDKRTHWSLASRLAREGFVVFNVNYRLAHDVPYPAAVQDVAAALRYVVTQAAAHGGDPSRIVWAGESAGANLVLAMTIAACWRRPEPWAQAIFDEVGPPTVLLPACGYLELRDPERHFRDRPMPAWIADRIVEVSDTYVPDHRVPSDAHAFANVLTYLESAPPPDRPLPPALAVVGDKDPVLDDTRRLGPAYERLGGACDVRVYPGAGHAFHALGRSGEAARAWDDQLACVRANLDDAPG